jgi:hypothetical protein
VKKITTLLLLFLIIISTSLTGCIGDKVNPKLIKLGLKDNGMQRIAITNNRYAGRYTIIDKKSIDNFTKIILNAKNVTIDSKLDPDFIFEFYDETKNVSSFKYIAGIDDENTANLIDMNGNLYHVSLSLEDEFMKRMMNSDSFKNIPDYYISLIGLLVQKSEAKKGETVVVDIDKDYVVTRNITSVEQKNILDSINSKGVRIKFPNETETWNYIIKINTSKYKDDSSEATASITDNKNSTIKYIIQGTYENGNWNYYIKYQ